MKNESNGNNYGRSKYNLKEKKMKKISLEFVWYDFREETLEEGTSTFCLLLLTINYNSINCFECID